MSKTSPTSTASDLTDLHPIVETGQPGMRGVGVFLLLAVLDEVLDRVESEAVDAQVLKPVAGNRVHLGLDGRVGQVEIRHALPEEAVIEPVAGRVPDLLAVGPAVARVIVGPDVPILMLRTRGDRVAEPGVLARGVVHDEVDDDRDAALVGGLDQGPELVGRAVVGLDCPVVGDVVAVIARGFRDRHQPHTGNAQVVRRAGVAIVQVVQLLGEPGEVAHAVAIRIPEAADEDLVEDPVVPPGRRQGRRRQAGGRRHLRRAGRR